MKRLIALVMLMLLLPALACAQGLDAGLEQALGQVDLAPLETAAREDNLRVYLLRLAKGEMIWDARQVLDTLHHPSTEAELAELIEESGFAPTVRGETLDIPSFASLANAI